MTHTQLWLFTGVIATLTAFVAFALFLLTKKFEKMIESDQKTRGLLREMLREMKKTREKESASQAA